jgi:hypothetical protein
LFRVGRALGSLEQSLENIVKCLWNIDIEGFYTAQARPGNALDLQPYVLTAGPRRRYISGMSSHRHIYIVFTGALLGLGLLLRA